MYVIEKKFYANGIEKPFYYVQGHAQYCSDIAQARKFRTSDSAEKCIVELGIADYEYEKKHGHDVSMKDCIDRSFEENMVIPYSEK